MTKHSYGSNTKNGLQSAQLWSMQTSRLAVLGVFHPRSVIIALALGVMLSGCAANMAATGRDGPDLNVVSQEATRQEVERQLGSPTQIQQHDDGQYTAVYDVEPRTKPNVTRAAGHGVLDIYTFGLWEVIGGPLEAANARRVLVSARYDKVGKLINLTSETKPIL